jgi:hypothetical protein
MAAIKSAASPTVILTNSSDWEDWIDSIQLLAKKDNVWKYIDPNEETVPALEEPTRPLFGQSPVNAP